ncbi:hypothetical protein BATDEDRAFT_88422 [Batrachochytrium dendrobatidis JAM81]|uniref:Dynein regulatory complex protein 12 n=1 Tax=Batrachochytrium dendrobatidis (strain JAM81 / FGSC 10211) TaxID=684364 RepID=F4P1X6_BATDJ|nr:uncharacterized protein BATDEDRAFT_88422 [Batrachochytrium dendrobatidis JAM81]EGF80763.1 hypothetical protein BATDEDRAFT_88422 [Batrachochytrium dendrobatidis JAM81]KAJ8328994.1 hypothetical protein O5D80_002955 [Batrachochytrium dendrobatidis]KAK5668946.1 hypothetical protein QVD99_004720 [Batrachochytrium dendrobatidis]|eukprot:XP_006678688.1 hypothetical protein BATDEDRAFT_88422 [Batrachochytrium dendrobatidis JAM81]
MPPKKSGSAKKKTEKSAPELADTIEMSLEDQLLKANLEMKSLQYEIEMKNDLNVRLRQQLTEHKQKINGLENLLEMRTQDRLELSSDMSRQYKTMQSEMMTKIESLEKKVLDLKSKLAYTQHTYSEEKRIYEATMMDKDALIEEQNMKMTYMTNEFEAMLNETLGRMTKKLEMASQRWKDNDHITLSDANAKRLEDFQLSRIALANIQI